MEPSEEIINKHIEQLHRNKVEQRVDKICCSLILLVNSLRDKIQVNDKDVIVSIPRETLDRIERLLTK